MAVVVAADLAKIALLEDTLLSSCTAEGVQDRTLVKLSDIGVRSLQIFRNIAGSRDELVQFLKDAVGLNPTRDPADYIEIARLVGVWSNASLVGDVLIKQKAERAASYLPPLIPLHEHEDAKELYEKDAGIGERAHSFEVVF